MIDPETPADWEDAVNQANFLLLIDSARQYGLVIAAMEINVERCMEILERGRMLGYTPKDK